MVDFNKPHIYRRQIIATGKYYIGKHKGGNKYYKGSGEDYKQDLKIYKNIKTEILEYVDDISKLNEREIYWLDKFDVVNNSLYYNKTNKSYGPIQQTDEWKSIQSDKMKGKSTTKGKTWIVNNTSNYSKNNTKGKTWKWSSISSIERNNKISESLLGRDITEWKQKYTQMNEILILENTRRRYYTARL